MFLSARSLYFNKHFIICRKSRMLRPVPEFHTYQGTVVTTFELKGELFIPLANYKHTSFHYNRKLPVYVLKKNNKFIYNEILDSFHVHDINTMAGATDWILSCKDGKRESSKSSNGFQQKAFKTQITSPSAQGN